MWWRGCNGDNSGDDLYVCRHFCRSSVITILGYCRFGSNLNWFVAVKSIQVFVDIFTPITFFAPNTAYFK